MLMRENKEFFSFAFDLGHVKYGVCLSNNFQSKTILNTGVKDEERSEVNQTNGGLHIVHLLGK